MGNPAQSFQTTFKMNLSHLEKEKITGSLAMKGLNSQVPRFWDRIKKAIATKGITFDKLLRMYAITSKAVEDIEAIVKEK